MPLLKERITPKLRLVASALVERMGEALGEKIYPHIALHLRRSVNPPVETWAAFARAARAYKPFVHIRVGVGVDRMRVVVFVEDYADDKLLFADNLAKNAAALAAYCSAHPTIHAYDILDRKGEPCFGRTITVPALRTFAKRMERVKGQHARFGISFDKAHPVVQNGPECLDAVMEATRVLRPFYDCGKHKFKLAR